MVKFRAVVELEDEAFATTKDVERVLCDVLCDYIENGVVVECEELK